MCGWKIIWNLNVGIIWNDFLGKTLSIKVDIGTILNDLHSTIVNGMGSHRVHTTHVPERCSNLA